MELRAPKNNREGFTLIEVMIVLAIAGVIILIVFLAVPALQRSSRNTQRRNDAARISGLMGEWVANHNGQLPAGVVFSGTPPANRILIEASDVSIYEHPASISMNTTANNVTLVNQLQIKTNVRCENNVLTAAGNTRAYAVAFAVETSSSTGNNGTPQCI